jgi:tetratricopeptide (TPR) repeat protein
MTRRRHLLLELARRRSLPGAATALFLALLGIACTQTDPRPPLEPVGLPALSRLEPAVRTEIERRATRVEELLARATTPATELADAFGSLGRVLDAHELPGAAARCYANAGRLAPREFTWPYLHGQLALASGAAASAETAQAAFAQALAISPDEPLALVGAARAAALVGDWETSRRLAERALGRDPGLALAWTVLANAQLGGGDAPGAAASFRRALQLQPGATRLHGQLATALARAGDTVGSQAEQRLRGEGTVAVDDPWLQQVAEERRDAVGQRSAGERLFLAGDLANALVAFEAAVAAAPDDPESRVGLGSALARSGRWPEAADQYREALRRAPNHALAHFNLAVAVQQLAATAEVAERERAAAEALEHYRAALGADPGLDDARQNLANLLRRTKRCSEAEAEYSALLARDPARSAAAAGLAACRARGRDYAGGLAVVERGLQAAPGNSSLLLTRARLLAAAPDDRVRDGAEALATAQTVVAAGATPLAVETAAMALAETGAFGAAVAGQEAAIAAAEAAHFSAAALSRMRGNLERYRRREPCRDPALD